MEDLAVKPENINVRPSDGRWAGRRVFITGNTGFMGSWLATRLISLGAEITGYALPPPTNPSLFNSLGLRENLTHITADVRNLETMAIAMRRAHPDIVFHLAAQPLVRSAHHQPTETFSTNLMGTVNLLEAIRSTSSVAAAVIVTTDKVYENHGRAGNHRETDPLGGVEPYGASKACAEIATEAYRQAYFANGPLIATVRAGNIIGGGDWALNRLVPDAVRAFTGKRVLKVRNPKAVRPWQHVLEPVTGMIEIAAGLLEHRIDYCGPWNLGPDPSDSQTVEWVAEHLASTWGKHAAWQFERDHGPAETELLTLASERARTNLGWRCIWSPHNAISQTIEWYQAYYDGEDMAKVTENQIRNYLYLKGKLRDEHSYERGRTPPAAYIV